LISFQKLSRKFRLEKFEERKNLEVVVVKNTKIPGAITSLQEGQ